ncbi:MAG: efflux RND transporter periplasmic adaptor subunit [Thermodesulfobacteriota bacterium]|nr:efflux RND transporter periplasmic adaptor subunit [Thermodesulfobacteriota bacterium]
MIGILLASLGTAGCQKSDSAVNSPAVKKPPLVTTAAVETGGITRTLQLNGTVEPFRLARLASPAEGPVIHLQVREGDAVAVGAILLSIGRKTGVDALIASLEEELKKEEDNLSRTRRLVNSNALPGEQLDIARAKYEQVKAQLVRAQESEQDYEVSAPFSGMVSRLLANEGDFVAPRAGLVEIYDPATLVLRTTVPERHAADLKMDMTADIRLDAYPDRAFTGRISRLYPFLEAQMRTRTIEITINEPVDLLPGMFGRIQLILESISDARIIPAQALLVTPRGEAVVFIVENGKAFQRQVKTGIEEKGRLQILSGVTPGEQVIVSGNEKLKDGAAIRLFDKPLEGNKKTEPKPTAESGTPDKSQAGER